MEKIIQNEKFFYVDDNVLSNIKDSIKWKTLKIYNTPKWKWQVLMYSCGPTVYSDAHIWNLRSYIFPDVLKKVLRIIWYKVKHIINITDVWHLTDDASDWEDKMELRAKKIWNNVWDISQKYTDAFIDDIQKLNIELPDNFTKATEYIDEQINMISTLEEKWYTYKTSDWIYFDTLKFPEYANFWKLDIKNLNKWKRVDFWEKKSVTDFALWKFSPKDEKRQMEWDSPWWVWFPWWHIECSAMINKELWKQIDIHTWWTDHIKVHHTNEVAQATCCNWVEPVNYWLHWEFLVLDSKKRIGKSEWNSIILSDLIKKWFDPLSYRYLVLMAHYRSFLTFSEDILNQAQAWLKKLKNEIKNILEKAEYVSNDLKIGKNTFNYINLIMNELLNDLNTAKAIAIFRESLKDNNLLNEEKVIIISIFEDIFSLWLLDIEKDDIPEDIIKLAEKRKEYREIRNYEESDKIRKEINKKWYEIKDKWDNYEIIKI